MSLSPAERKLRAQIAAYGRWANVADPEERRKATEPGRRAALESWERKADPDGLLAPAVRRTRAEALRRQHMALMAFKSSQARRAKEASTSTESAA